RSIRPKRQREGSCAFLCNVRVYFAARLDRSADFQSAVSPNCIRQSVASVRRSGVAQRLAECNSAIQQSTTLRYSIDQTTLVVPGTAWSYQPSARGFTGGSASQAKCWGIKLIFELIASSHSTILP